MREREGERASIARLRCRLSFALLRSAILCLHGACRKKAQPSRRAPCCYCHKPCYSDGLVTLASQKTNKPSTCTKTKVSYLCLSSVLDVIALESAVPRHHSMSPICVLYKSVCAFYLFFSISICVMYLFTCCGIK